MDRLRAMSVFVSVANGGSLSAAARELGEPLTNISRLLGQLEAHVGATLVSRTTRNRRLTKAGEEYLEVCRRVLDELNAIENQLSGRKEQITGEIGVTAPLVFGRRLVLPLVRDFLSAHPSVSVRLLLSDHNVELTKENVDVALRIGALPDSSLLATRIGKMRILTCAAPSYLRYKGTPQTPADLAKHDCIAFTGLPASGRWNFASAGHGRFVVKPRARLYVNAAEAAIDAAEAGLGITRVLSYQAEPAIRGGSLVTVLGEFDDVTIPVHLVRRPTRHQNPAVRQFTAFLAKSLAKRLP